MPRPPQTDRPGIPAPVAVVDGNACRSCGACVDICPVGAMTINDKAQIDPAACLGCGQCVMSCPNGAISLK